MGKRGKKKMVQGGGPAARAGSKATPSSSSDTATSSPSASSSAESSRSLETSGAAVDNSARCSHGANLEKLRTQLAKSQVIHCQDCAKRLAAVAAAKEQQRKGNKGSVVVRKKPSPSSSSLGLQGEKKSNSKLWMCLFCGQVGCGESSSSNGGGCGVRKTEAKQGIVGWGHAWQHWLQLKHPMVMLFDEEFLCWCFVCEMAHAVERDHVMPPESSAGNPSSLENGADASSPPPSRMVVLQQSAKLIREKLAAQLVDVKNDSQAAVVKDVSQEPNGDNFVPEFAEKPHSPPAVENGVQEKPEVPPNSRVMKGLINLGNTCFFNSVMQNLLSVELLRSHFGPESCLPEGVLMSALRKFFQEASFHPPTESVTGLPKAGGAKEGAKAARGGWSSIDGTYNPEGLFRAICAKVPRFKGFQQQDSHELLRCLLDGLQTEEENALKDTAPPKSKSGGGGEDALRALSGTDNVDDAGVSSSPHQEDAEGTATENHAGEQQKDNPRPETFVERVFGGQLLSTISCCECGHSSVVYESFLDLSLPIPSKKSSTKKGSALANGTASATYTKSQKAQALKSSKTRTSKAAPDIDAFRSVPAGLGTPLLLLPAPPPKHNNNFDSLNTGTGPSNDGWLDYIDTGTGAMGEVDWLDFLDDDGSVDSGSVVGCAPNPNPESQIVLTNAQPSPEFEIVFGCAPNPDLMKLQTLEISAVTSGAKGILSPPANVSNCLSTVDNSMEFEQRDGQSGSADLFSVPNGNVISQSVDTRCCENFTLLEAASEAIAEANKSPTGCGAGAGIRPVGGQGMDTQVQMRGGSEAAQTADAIPEAYINSDPVSEQQLSDTNVGVEQGGGDCNDDTSPQSDIIRGPNGSTVILLGPPPVDSGYSNVELEGEYDGVGSLFDEEDSNAGQIYGPFLLNDDSGGAGFHESTYDDMVFDDVLDLSKITCEVRPEWLVTDEEERQDDDNAETAMSLEGCLQIFTRPELLSGQNAWACENCTIKYHENLAISDRSAMGPEEVLVSSPQMLPLKRGGSDYCGNGPNKDASMGGSVSSDFHKEGDVGNKWDVSGKGLEFVKAGEIDSPGSVEPSEIEPSVSSCGMNGHADGQPLSNCIPGHVDVGENDASQNDKVVGGCFGEGQQENTDRGDSISSQRPPEPVDLQDSGTKSRPDTEIERYDELVTLAGSQVVNSSGGVGGYEDGHGQLEAERQVNAAEVEKKVSVCNAQNSGKTSTKLRKSKSKKVPSGEQKKVIKQDATKRFLISRAPLVLTIQLKRFAQDMRGRLNKLSGHVSFQEELDLHPFLDPRHINLECKYRLIGTVEHSGTLKNGHYVAFVRGPPTESPTGATSGEGSSWYYISDSHVHQTNLEAVLQSEAYLIFYERVDTTGGISL